MDKINLLFLKDINSFLKNENFEYLCYINNEESYYICEIPPIYSGYISELVNYMCYDYNKISKNNQELFKNEYKSFTKVEENIYKIETKKYSLKKNNQI